MTTTSTTECKNPKEQLKEVISNISHQDAATASQLLDDRIRELRLQNRERLVPGEAVKIFTQSNEVHGTLVHMASVQATVKFVDGTEEKVDIAVLAPKE